MTTSASSITATSAERTPAYPFAAIVGQDDLKLALRLSAVDPRIGGVLAYGDRGTGKSTAVRALADLLPKVRRVVGCPYQCDPEDHAHLCDACRAEAKHRHLRSRLQPVPVVDLPLGATEDRVVGALDLERALTAGEKVFEPGLLARANRGFLYIDEVNLLEDHLVDLLLDVAASGENVVEREGLSVRHQAAFVLVGSGNPEEGELRPQLLDRFGLCVDVATPAAVDLRVEVIRRREAYDRDPFSFAARWRRQQSAQRKQILTARAALDGVEVADTALSRTAELCLALGTDGLRGELTLIRAARALAALAGDGSVNDGHLRRVAQPALAHRLRRDPLDDSRAGTRVARVLDDLFDA